MVDIFSSSTIPFAFAIANFVDVNMVSGAPSYLSFIHFEAQVKLSPNFREI
jgi:hypothetical protein